MIAVLDQAAGQDAQAEAAAHCILQFGRVLLLNGVDTARAQTAMRRMGQSLGCDAHLLISYEALLVSVGFTTKIGSRIPAMNVGMSTAAAAFAVMHAVEDEGMTLSEATHRLEALEHPSALYNHWLVALALGLTAASLSRLFGGDWPAFFVCWIAGFAGTLLRQEGGKRGIGPVALAFIAALASGMVGGLGARLLGSTTGALCLVAPGMIIVPGVPLINGVQDMIRNHAETGVARIGFSFFVIGAIGLGLFLASLISADQLPLAMASLAPPLWQDAVFSAIAALGFVLLFSVPLRLAWACALCGMASHSLRALLMHWGVDILAGTLIGAFVAGSLAQIFARRLHAPAATFAFPGVVALVPGIYGFRTIAGAIQIVTAPAPSATLIDQTVALGLSVLLLTAAIAIGVAAPLAIAAPGEKQRR